MRVIIVLVLCLATGSLNVADASVSYDIETVLKNTYERQEKALSNDIKKKSKELENKNEICWEENDLVIASPLPIIVGPRVKKLYELERKERERLKGFKDLHNKMNDKAISERDRKKYYKKWSDEEKEYIMQRDKWRTSLREHQGFVRKLFGGKRLSMISEKLDKKREAYYKEYVSKVERQSCVHLPKLEFAILKDKQRLAILKDNFNSINEELKISSSPPERDQFEISEKADTLTWKENGKSFQLWHKCHLTLGLGGWYACKTHGEYCTGLHKTKEGVWKFKSQCNPVVYVDKNGNGHKRDRITINKFLLLMNKERETGRHETFERMIDEKKVVKEFLHYELQDEVEKQMKIVQGKITGRFTVIWHKIKRWFKNKFKKSKPQPPPKELVFLPRAEHARLKKMRTRVEGGNFLEIGKDVNAQNTPSVGNGLALLETTLHDTKKWVDQQKKVLDAMARLRASKDSCFGRSFAQISEGLLVDSAGNYNFHCLYSHHLCTCMELIGDYQSWAKFELGSGENLLLWHVKGEEGGSIRYQYIPPPKIIIFMMTRRRRRLLLHGSGGSC